MKKLILAFFAVLSFQSFGQTAEVKPEGKLAIGLTFSPDYCYRTLKAEEGLGYMLSKDNRDNIEVSKFGFTTGASVQYNFSKRLALESGLLYSAKGFKTNKICDYQIDHSDEYDQSDQIYFRYQVIGGDYLAHDFHGKYLDIPAKVNYYFSTGKARLFVSAGASANILLSYKAGSTLKYIDGRTEMRNLLFYDKSKFNLTGIASVGVDYCLTEKLQIRVEPIYRRSVTSIRDAPIKGYLYSTGLNLGIFMKL